MSALSDFVGVKQENLVLGAGSTEILQMAVQAYQGPNTPLVTAEPTFEDVPPLHAPARLQLGYGSADRARPGSRYWAHAPSRRGFAKTGCRLLLQSEQPDRDHHELTGDRQLDRRRP